jgi:transcriptional regulator GlxA family with amidase domain
MTYCGKICLYPLLKGERRRMLKIGIMAYENCLQSGIAGMLDLFTLANWERRRQKKTERGPFCRCDIVTIDGQAVNSFNRQPIVANTDFKTYGHFDLLIIPGMMGRPELLFEQKKLVNWVRTQHQQGTIVASACSGAFLLAATGVLKKRLATTHWQLADRFRQHFPRVELNVNRLLIDGDDYLCAGGTSAHVDLARYIIEKYGSPNLARSCARFMLLEERPRDQAPYVRFHGCRSHGDEAILKVQKWLDTVYRENISVKQMCALSTLNERTFLRRFKKATGEGPLAYLQKMRLEKAKQMLTSTDLSIEQITVAVGYVDVSSFRRLFRQSIGLSPTLYRQRFTGA